MEPPQKSSIIVEQPKAAPAANLLDFDDDFTEFSAASSNVSPSNFASFPAPQTQQSSTLFASFPAPQQSSTLFASFPAPQTQQSTTLFADFSGAPFVTQPSLISPTSNSMGFASFQSTAFPGISSAPFKASNTESTPRSVQADEFGDFQSVRESSTSPAKANPEDHFAKLVSLDAFSLGSTGQKKEQTGPSLNTLGRSRFLG